MTQPVTIESFANLLAEEALPQEYSVLVLAILAEISPHATAFRVNSSELVQLAARYSPTFQALNADKQAFVSSVLTMPLFFTM